MNVAHSPEITETAPTQHTETAPRLAYRLHGDAGPRVLLVMGFGMRGDVWGAQVEGLAGSHQVATFDHRGLGDSETTEGRWSMADMARDALRVADALGWERFHLVGVSMGGMIVQELALMAPARIETLTMIATNAGGGLSWVPPLDGLKLFLKANLARTSEKRIGALQKLLYPESFAEGHSSEALADRMRLQFGTPAPQRTRLIQLLAVMRHRTTDRLKQLQMPTLVVRPGQDRLVKSGNNDRIYGLIPGARMLSLSDAGHGAIYQRAETINAALIEHFAVA